MLILSNRIVCLLSTKHLEPGNEKHLHFVPKRKQQQRLTCIIPTCKCMINIVDSNTSITHLNTNTVPELNVKIKILRIILRMKTFQTKISIDVIVTYNKVERLLPPKAYVYIQYVKIQDDLPYERQYNMMAL